MEDERWRSVVLDVAYPGQLLHLLGPVIRPWVRLEIGSARVTPFLERRISAWVHDFAENNGGLEGIHDNRPVVRCIHPQVTLIEKLDAMMRRWGREELPATTFVRHYEDAARVIAALPELPPIAGTAGALMAELLEGRQIRALPDPDHPALTSLPGPRTEELRKAHAAIGGMFWGRRIPLEEACATIRGWIGENLVLSA